MPAGEQTWKAWEVEPFSWEPPGVHEMATAFSLLGHPKQPLPTWLFLKKSRTSPDSTVQSRSENALEALHGEEQGVQKNREIQKDAAVLDIVQVILDRLMNDELAVAA